jgi:hypothetical protein
MEAIETRTLDHGITLTLYSDPEPLNPRTEYEEAAHMVCWHPDYNLGDRQIRLDNSEATSIEEFILEQTEDPNAVVLMLWLYDHSGITISATEVGVNCPFWGDSAGWDTSVVGFIFMTTADIVREYGSDTPENRTLAKEQMFGEVQTYDDYLTNNCYGYVIEDTTGNELESLWGMLGDIDEYVWPEALQEAEFYVKCAAWAEAEDLTHGTPLYIGAPT